MKPDIHFNLYEKDRMSGAVADVTITFPKESETGELTLQAVILREDGNYEVSGLAGCVLGERLSTDVLQAFASRGSQMRRIVAVELTIAAKDTETGARELNQRLAAVAPDVAPILYENGLRLSVEAIPNYLEQKKGGQWEKVPR